jgi:hypothetical protein
VRDALAHAVEDAEEALAAVRAAHRLEDAVGPRLQRHVQLRHDGGGLGHRVDDVVGEGSRVRAREADALEAGISPAARRSLPNAWRSPNSTP